MRYRILFLLIVAALAFGIWAMWIADEGQGLFPRRYQPPDHAQFLAKLAEPTTVRAQDVPLRDLLDQMATRHGVDIRFDESALAQPNVANNIPITVDAQGISLTSTIRIILRLADTDLRLEVNPDSLLITHHLFVGTHPENFVGRVYPLGALMSAPERIDEHELRFQITMSRGLDSWSSANGKGEILALPGGLAVAHTLDVHLQIEALLARLEDRIECPEDLRPIDVSHALAPGNARALAALDRPITVEWKDVPLREVCTRLSNMLGVPVLLDSMALDATVPYGSLAAYPTVPYFDDLPVTIVAQDQPLREVLRWPLNVVLDMSDSKEMAFVWDEAIWISASRSAPYSLKIYPVGDFPPEAVSGFHENYIIPAPPRDGLVDLIKSTIALESWVNFGGGGEGTAAPLGDTLVVYQQQHMHRRIERSIGQLRETLAYGGTGTSPDVSPTRRRVEAALAESVTYYAARLPLAEVATHLGRQHGIRILIHEGTLAEIGETAAMPITLRAEDISLEQALYRMLTPHGLTFVVQGDSVVITNSEWAECHHEVRMYDVRHLVDPDVGLADADQLEVYVTSSMSPASWMDGGGPGTIEYFAGVLVVAQQRHVHQEVASFLDGLTHYQRHPESLATIRITPRQHAGVDKLADALRQTVSFEHWQMRLDQVAADLSERFAVPIVAQGRWRDTVVDIHARNISLAAALDLMLRDWRADFQLRFGQVEISDPDWGCHNLQARIYPVRDLLYHPAAPPNPPPGPDFPAPLMDGVSRAAVDYDSLAETIVAAIEPETWMDRGGDAYIDYCEGALIVANSWQAHQKIERLLAEMRHSLWPSRHRHPGPTPVDQILERRATLDTDGAPLSNFLADVAREQEIVVHYTRPEPLFESTLGQLIWLPTPPRPARWTDDPFAIPYPRFLVLDDYLRWLLRRRPIDWAMAGNAGEETQSVFCEDLAALHPLDLWFLRGAAWAAEHVKFELRPDEPNIRCHRQDVTLGEALHEVLAPLRYVLCSDGEVVHVCPVDDDTRPLMTRVYDVRRLAPPHTPAPTERHRGMRPYVVTTSPVVGNPDAEFPFVTSPFDPFGEFDLPAERRDEFALFVIANLPEETRSCMSDDAIATIYQGLLVVRNDWHTHREIAALLTELNHATRDLPPVAQLIDGSDPNNMDRLLQELRSADDGIARNYLAFLFFQVAPESELRQAIHRWKTADDPEMRKAGIEFEQLLGVDCSGNAATGKENTE